MDGSLHEQATSHDEAKASWIERVLGVTLSTPTGGAAAAAKEAGKPRFSKVAFEKIHLEWEGAKKLIEARLDLLGKQVLCVYADDEAQLAVRKLDNVLTGFNLGFADKLDELRNADSPELQAKLARDAGGIAQSYLVYLSGDALVAHVEDNPYGVTVDAPAVLGAPLRALQQELAKLGW